MRFEYVERHFAETYNITLVKGFAGDSISILLNDSVLADRRIGEEPDVYKRQVDNSIGQRTPFGI